MIKIVFISNFLNTHVSEICDNFYASKDVIFHFIACEKPNEFRKKVGQSCERPKYVLKYYENGPEKDSIIKTCSEADFCIFGSGSPSLLSFCLSKNVIIFLYSEHLFKKKTFPCLRRIKAYISLSKIVTKSYVLCSSSYTRKDYLSAGLKAKNFVYWGYFPKGNILKPLPEKREQTKKIHIFWSGRFIKWKHPEKAIESAAFLKKRGIRFSLTMAGDGEQMEKTKKLIKKKGLSDCVFLLGEISNEMVLNQMLKSEIFLFTSDHREGWGAVLNEAMSSGCCCIASEAAGSSDFLISHEKNGLLYKTKKQMLSSLLTISQNSDLMKKYGEQARITMESRWSSESATSNLLFLFSIIENKKPIPKTLINNGPGTIIQV